MGVSIAVAIASYFAASAWVQYDTSGGIAIYIALVGWMASSLLIAVLLTRKISQVTGTHYRPTIHNLAVAFTAMFLATCHEGIFSFFVTNGDFYLDSGIYLWPVMVSGLLLVRASYSFNLLSAQVEHDTTEDITAPATDDDYLTSITSTASLAAQPRDIETVLDDVRIITSHLSHDRLTATQKQQLVKTYFRLEDYLVTKDPLRAYQKEQVRNQLRLRFRAVVERAS